MLRELWRLRRYVIGVGVLALLAGLAVMYRIPSFESRQYQVGVATAQILVDTPSSQVVAVAPRGSGTTGVQANLLSSLMVDGVIKATIANQAGIQPNQLVGVTNGATQPSSAGPTPISAPSGPDAFVLTTQVLTDSAGDNLPIIQVGAQAPTSAAASRLAGAAISGVRDYLNSKAALERTPTADRLRITGLASQATTETRGPSNAIVLLIVIVVFGLGCAGMLAVQQLIRGWRAASAGEQLEDDRVSVSDVGITSHDVFFGELFPDDEALGCSPASEEVLFDELPEGKVPARPPGRKWLSEQAPSTAHPRSS